MGSFLGKTCPRRACPAKTWLVCALCGATFVGLACATAGPGGDPGGLPVTPDARIPSGPDAERSPDGLVRVLAPERPGALWVQGPRPNLQRYDRMILMPARIEYREGVRAWDSLQEERLRGHFDASLRRTLDRAAGWKIAREPGPGVLRVSIYALDLEIHAAREISGSRSNYVASAGDVLLVLELRDSVSGQSLLRFMQRRMLPGGSFGGTGIDGARVQRAFTRFAADLGDQLDDYYAAAKSIEEQERGGGEEAVAPPS